MTLHSTQLGGRADEEGYRIGRNALGGNVSSELDRGERELEKEERPRGVGKIGSVHFVMEGITNL